MLKRAIILEVKDSVPHMSKNSLCILVGCGIKSMWLIFKIEMLIYLSKANLDEKILFGKIFKAQK